MGAIHMHDAKFKLIDTERLLLRQFVISDYKQSSRNFLRDKKVDKYLDWNAHKCIFQSIKYCREMSKKPYHWAIVLKEINQVIGFVRSQKQSGILVEGDCPDQ